MRRPRLWDTTYWPTGRDPIYRLQCTAPWGTCRSEGMRVRVPAAAVDWRRHLRVIDPCVTRRTC